MFYQSLMHPAFVSKVVRVCASFMALAFFILTLTAQQVGAAIVTVTNTADSGAGSLRQAIADANGTSDADTINFNVPSTDSNCDSNGVCTITLTGGIFTIQAAGGALNIANQTGAGKLLISGNNATGIFDVQQGANLTLDGLTVTRGIGLMLYGTAYGVVRNFRGTLTIINSAFVQNLGFFVITSSASETGGNLNVINTSVSSNSGVGILFTNNGTNSGILNIINSTISNNRATDGPGGISFTGSQLTITNSTVSGNTCRQGCGIYAALDSRQNSSILLTNSTITANKATSSGGGIYVDGANIKLRNTIVAGNTSSNGAPDFHFQSGGATSLGNNLIGNATNTGSGTGQWLASDILNQDARLAPLGNNGGATETHALLPDSPAINHGDNTDAPETDQRGFTRIVGGTIDIGAFEFAPIKTRKRVRITF